MSTIGAKLVVVATTCFLLALMFSNAASAQLKGFSGGPIVIKETKEDGSEKITAREATRIAASFVGSEVKPTTVNLAIITDKEYIGGLLKDKRCWLLEYQDLVVAKVHGTEEKELKVSGYAVVDSNTGAFYLAATVPKKPWWERVKWKDGDVVGRYAHQREHGTSLKKPPKTTLLGAVDLLVSEEMGDVLEKSEQVIARCFGHTTENQGIPIFRIDHVQILPEFSDEPVWLVSFEGVRQKRVRAFPGSSVAKTYIYEEVNVLIDATNETIISRGMYR